MNIPFTARRTLLLTCLLILFSSGPAAAASGGSGVGEIFYKLLGRGDRRTSSRRFLQSRTVVRDEEAAREAREYARNSWKEDEIKFGGGNDLTDLEEYWSTANNALQQWSTIWIWRKEGLGGGRMRGEA